MEEQKTDTAEAPTGRKPAIALLLSLVCPGLGLVYAGRLRAAIGVFAAMVLVIPAAGGIAIRLQVDTFAILTAVAVVGVSAAVFQAVLSVRAAVAVRRSYVKTRVNHIGVYLGFVALNLISPASRIVKHTALETFRMSSNSGAPNLLPGDYIAAVKGRAPSLGDVVVFKRPTTAQNLPADTAFVYRLVALGGDTVEMRRDQLYRNGKAVPRKALGDLLIEVRNSLTGGPSKEIFAAFEETNGTRAYRVIETPGVLGDFGPITVPVGHFFVLGDNRDNANDSRYWGSVPEANLIGAVEAIWLSIAPDGSGVRWERIGRAL